MNSRPRAGAAPRGDHDDVALGERDRVAVPHPVRGRAGGDPPLEAGGVLPMKLVIHGPWTTIASAPPRNGVWADCETPKPSMKLRIASTP
jgi:hypothetical protein